MNVFSAFNLTSIGASHIASGRLCQDCSISENNELYKLAAVSDGHGSADYFRSDRGSSLAALAFSKCVAEAFSPSDGSKGFKELLSGENAEEIADELLHDLVVSVKNLWNELVDEDIAEDPFTENELAFVSECARNQYLQGIEMNTAYGATLIGVVFTDDFWFGIHVGDGKCVAFGRNGEVTEPIPWDENCFKNVTTSICSPEADKEFRYCFSKDLPSAVFLGSDGIDDSFASTKYHHDFYRVILASFAEEEENSAIELLGEFLPELSAQGSGDDMSIAFIADISFIQEHVGFFLKKKRPCLRIYRIGCMSNKFPAGDYAQKGETEAYIGKINLNAMDCGGGSNIMNYIEITAVSNEAVTFIACGKEYTVTPDSAADITTSETVDGYCLFDKVVIQFLLK